MSDGGDFAIVGHTQDLGEWTPPPRRWRVDGVRMTKRIQKKRASQWMQGERARLRRLYPIIRRHHDRVRHHAATILSAGVTGRIYGVRIVEDYAIGLEDLAP